MSDSESGLDNGDGHSHSDDDDDDHSSHSSLVFDSDEERWSKNSFTDSPLNSMVSVYVHLSVCWSLSVSVSVCLYISLSFRGRATPPIFRLIRW